MIDLDGMPIWLFLLSIIVAGLGYFIRSLAKKVDSVDLCVHQMKNQFVHKETFDATMRELKEGLFRLEVRLDHKLDQISDKIDKKVDRQECYRLHSDITNNHHNKP